MADLIWPRTAGPLTLRPPTSEDLDQALTWRNSPEVTRWLLMTTVDPAQYKRDWLAEDDDDIGVAAFVRGEFVGGRLHLRDPA